MDINNLEWSTEWNSYADIYTGQLYTISEVAAATAASNSDWGSVSEIIESIGTGAKDVITALNAFQIQQLNIDRAKKGLPPLDPARYAPQVGINLSANTMNMLLIGMVGIGAVMLLKGKR